MSLLKLIFGRRPAPPPPPPAPPREISVVIGERTYTAHAGPGGQYIVHGFEPEPAPAPEPPSAPVIAMPGAWFEQPPAVDPSEIAVVRRPITDGDGEVVGYELVAGGDGVQGTAGMLLDVFGDVGLDRLAGRHPAWVRIDPEFLLEIGTPPVRPHPRGVAIA